MEYLLGTSLTSRQKRTLAVVLLVGGSSSIGVIRQAVSAAKKEQKQLCLDLEKTDLKKKRAKPGVDKVFLRRLLRILSICIPGVFSKEAGLVFLQGSLLFSRTILTLRISKVEGRAGKACTSQDFQQYWRAILALAGVGVPAAIVNAALKYLQKRIQLAFQERVTKNLHRSYCSNRAYYAASTLGGLTNADQRITEDVEKFAFAISELYDRTFKPLLDVILFTRALAPVMGYKGQFFLYMYYLATGAILKTMSPPLAQMTAQESALTGSFRTAHQRLVTNAEEIAFNDPPGGVAEQLILNQHLTRLLRYIELSAFMRFVQKVADDYFVKYLASAVSLVVYGAPLYFAKGNLKGASQGELTSEYIRSMRLLQNTSRGIGDLVMVYKRVTSLAGHTSRVAELLEEVERLSKDGEHKKLFRSLGSTEFDESQDEKINSDFIDDNALPPPRREMGSSIRFERVALNSPDGTPLVRDLCFEVTAGHSVMLMGPNGSGKSSLLRVLAGLWPILSGTVTTPGRNEVFYLSQRPYVVTGTLRDQLLYPDPPKKTWKSAGRDDRRCFAHAKGRAPAAVDEAHMVQCLQAVELEYLLERGEGWDQFQKWEETLSGGERQRLAMARLLYHKPKFAVLDEATSAVSADGEQKLYEACIRANVTMLSIGHRPSLKQFHSTIVHFDGSQKGSGWSIEKIG
ncbi:hypothetical protein BSKO_07444 [Bryopsis sp. KO-2023]|nr:hypothetical protein BSKO_07444 [Bryopsis sp. KO-2023]